MIESNQDQAVQFYLSGEFTEMVLDVQRVLGGPYRSPSLTVLAQLTAIKATSIGNWHEKDWEPLLRPRREDWSVTSLVRPQLDHPFTFGFYETTTNLVQHVWYHNLLQTDMNKLYRQIYDQYVVTHEAFKDQLITNDRLATAILLVTYMLATRDLTDLPESIVGCVEVWYAHWIIAQEEILRTQQPQQQKHAEPADQEVAYLMREQRAIRAVSRALELYDCIYKDDQLLSWGDDGRYENKRYTDEISLIETEESIQTQQEGVIRDAPKGTTKTETQEEEGTAEDTGAGQPGNGDRPDESSTSVDTLQAELAEDQRRHRRIEYFLDILNHCENAHFHVSVECVDHVQDIPSKIFSPLTGSEGLSPNDFYAQKQDIAVQTERNLQSHDFTVVGGVQEFDICVSLIIGAVGKMPNRTHLIGARRYDREAFLHPQGFGGISSLIEDFFEELLYELGTWKRGL